MLLKILSEVLFWSGEITFLFSYATEGGCPKQMKYVSFSKFLRNAVSFQVLLFISAQMID